MCISNSHPPIHTLCFINVHFFGTKFYVHLDLSSDYLAKSFCIIQRKSSKHCGTDSPKKKSGLLSVLFFGGSFIIRPLKIWAKKKKVQKAFRRILSSLLICSERNNTQQRMHNKNYSQIDATHNCMLILFPHSKKKNPWIEIENI